MGTGGSIENPQIQAEVLGHGRRGEVRPRRDLPMHQRTWSPNGWGGGGPTRSPIPTHEGRSPGHPPAKSFRMWRQKAAISNCLQSSLKNIKHVQLALVQKRKNNKRHSGPCGHPPTPASWATSASAPTTPGSPIVPPGFHRGRRRESSNERLTGEGGDVALSGGAAKSHAAASPQRRRCGRRHPPRSPAAAW